MIGFTSHPWMSELLGDEELAGLFSADAELKRYLEIESAWSSAMGAVTNCSQAKKAAEKIIKADIDLVTLKSGFAKDGVPIPALVNILKEQVGQELAIWVHEGLTSQDVIDTALVITLRHILAILQTRIDSLNVALEKMLVRFSNKQVMAYTRMQPALETRAEDIIRNWQRPLGQLVEDCKRQTAEIAIIQLGGPIGKRDIVNASDIGAAFANNLNLSDPGYCWHTDRTVISNVVHLITRITTVTGKIGEDVALMAALGPEHLSIEGGISSAMAHKNNPIKAETLISLSNYAAMLQSGLTLSARHEAMRSGKAWMLEWISLPQLCFCAGTSLLLAPQMLKDIRSFGVD